MRNRISPGLVLGLVLVAGIMFDVANRAQAQVSPAWPAKSCTITLPGGGQTTVQCSVTYADCANFQQVIPNGTQLPCNGSNRYRACVNVCNVSHVVVDVACVCACLDADPPRHENCPVAGD